MKLSTLIFGVATLASSCVSAAQVWAGSNLYYAAGLSPTERYDLFQAMNAANMKVLRVWLDGQSTATTKDTTITSWPDLEVTAPGTFNDTVLDLLDAVMVDANAWNIKLLISCHSWNALSRPDIYGEWWGTGDFYTETTPQQEFDNRLNHIVNHVHTSLGVPWYELSDYIFAFEAENEAMIGNGQTYIEDNTAWQCDRAQTLQTALGSDSGILVVTGGESWMAESVQQAWLDCEYIDAVSIHAYGTGDFDTASIQSYVQQAQAAGTMLLFEEWGACYYDTSNNDCDSGDVLSTSQRNANIQAWADQISAAGVPWLYWEVLPNADPHYGSDYEVGITGDPSWSTLEAAAVNAGSYEAAFDYSAYLL